MKKKSKKININKKKVNDYLGAPRFFSDLAEGQTKPGVVTGLAWTAAGGDILFVESSKMNGKGNLTLTGQLGDVMKESASAALTFVRSNSENFGIDNDFNEKTDIHVHVPAGAIPNDGPSAGVGMFTSILSLLSGIPVKSKLAMTGEITLRGSVLPIGGVKEKVTAAFKLILADNNVKGILINIFGGIMRCDVLAQGVVDAAKEVNLAVPLVVRLAGTNFKEGKEILERSKLKILSAADLNDAAKKIVEAIK